jgi:3-hydroxymyristoyl/3-hydroxydecanoyl-(acyl carrier protein) dehydratase
MLAKKNNIIDLIPQKFPMVMVDGLISNDEDVTVSKLQLNEFNIFCSDGYFHEPGLIENIAQTAALRSGYEAAENHEEPVVGYIGSVKRMIIKDLPKDNDTLKTKITIINRLMNVLIIQGEVMVDTKLMAEGEMNIFLQQK